jgi:DNA-directed RNA polymerase subunit N (RpoN/RPB10)
MYYVNQVGIKKQEQKKENVGIQYFSDSFKDKSIEGEVLDELLLTKQCCRRHMLGHVDIF